MAYLEVLIASTGKKHILLDDEVILGRHPGNPVYLDDQRVSRYHARIWRQGDRFFIEDLDSKNGVFIQETKLLPRTPHALHDRDAIRICSAWLIFHHGTPEATAAQQAVPGALTSLSGMSDASLAPEVTLHHHVTSPAVPTQPDGAREPHIAITIDASVSMLDVAADERQTDKGLREALRRLQALCQVGTALMALVDREKLLQRVLEIIFDLFPEADRAFILLRDDDSQALVPVATKCRNAAVAQEEVAISHTIIDEVLTQKRSILSVDAMGDERFQQHESIMSFSIRSMMCAPLLAQDQILGLIQVDTAKSTQSFVSADLQLLTGIAAQAALAVKNTQLNELEEHLRVMTIINRIGTALSAERDSTRLLRMIVEGARSITHADGGALYIVTPERQLQLSTMRIASLDLTLDSSTEAPIPLYGPSGRPNTSVVAAYCALKATTINIPDISTVDEFDVSGNRRFDAQKGYRSQSFLSVPLMNHEHEILGVLQLINAYDQQSQRIVPFSEEDQRLAESLASQAAVGLSRQRLLQALAESEKRYRDLVEKSPGAICMHDLEGTLLFVNQAWAQALGYEPYALVGRSVTEVLAPAVRPLLATYLQHISQQPAADGLARMLGRDGKERVWSYRSIRHEEAGRPAYVLTYAQDITEYRRLEAHLRQSQKMEAIGTLAGGIAHDFNNILSTIMGYTEVTLEDTPTNSFAWKNLQRVLTAGKRARDLVQQILAFSRRGEAGRKPVELHLILQEELKLLRASLPTTIDIRQHIDPSAGAVLADATQMHQVVLNLCANAEYAMRETGGVLTVRLEAVDVTADLLATHPELRHEAYTRLTVADTGHGMTREVMARIFEPFFTTKGSGEGTGMGLAMVHGIVANHNGAITVKSQPGEGTTFEIYLPRVMQASETDAHTDEPAGRTMHGVKKRVMVVDDEEPIACLGQLLIERFGHEALSYTNSLKALEAFRQSPQDFDLVITDQTMPHMAGEALVKALRSLRPDIPVIICTGFSHTMTQERAAELGINAFLMKPLEARDLERVVRDIFAC